MERFPDWAARLSDFIDEIKASPFDWSADCFCGWAAGAVMAQTGKDIAVEFRGKYKTAKGALRVLKRKGVDNLADGVALYLPRYDHPSQAQVGDIAAIPKDDEFGFTLGIVNGESILVPGELCMGVMPREAATQAFKVG